LLLIVGGVVGFLPVLGFWMIPLGLLLLAQDVPFLQRPILRSLTVAGTEMDQLEGSAFTMVVKKIGYRYRCREPSGVDLGSMRVGVGSVAFFALKR
jgi:hypothetical protein